MPNELTLRATVTGIVWMAGILTIHAGEPPTVNPFGPPTAKREDAMPGVVELSDGTVHAGLVYLTRDKRLQIYDRQLQRQREIPLRVIKKIECSIQWEELKKEWRFKEGASDVKLYTGRSYPAREYLHTITLNDGRTITGPLSALIYLKPKPKGADQQPPMEPKRFLLSKRGKGNLGQDLKSLIYVKRITLGGEKN